MSSRLPRSARKNCGDRKLRDMSDAERGIIHATRARFGDPIFILGSRSRGNYAPDSDIDLAARGIKRSEQVEWCKTITEKFGIKLDLFAEETALSHKSTRLI